MTPKKKPYKQVKIGKRKKNFETAWDYFMWKYGFRLFAVIAAVFMIMLSAVIYVVLTGDMQTPVIVFDSLVNVFAFIGEFIFLLGAFTNFDKNMYAIIGLIEMIIAFLVISVFMPTEKKP